MFFCSIFPAHLFHASNSSSISQGWKYLPFQGFLEDFLNVCLTQECNELSVASRTDITFKGLIYDLLKAKTHVLPVPTNGPLHMRLTKAGKQTHYPLLTLALPQKGTANTKILTSIKGKLKGT